jgi:hypothetical protein
MCTAGSVRDWTGEFVEGPELRGEQVGKSVQWVRNKRVSMGVEWEGIAERSYRGSGIYRHMSRYYTVVLASLGVTGC